MEYLSNIIEKYGPYLEDIRKRLYRITIFFALVYISGFSLSGPIFRTLLKIFNFNNVVVATSSPFQLANLSMDMGMFLAILLTTPLIVYNFFSFSSNALSKEEKKWMFLYIPTSVLLFILGSLYAFFILHYSFDLLASFGDNLGVKNIWDIGQFISQTYMTAMLLGFTFQMPIILTVLIRLRVLNVKSLINKRRFAYVLVVILVSLLPPTDGLSLMVMSMPLILLYEASIFINRNIKKHV